MLLLDTNPKVQITPAYCAEGHLQGVHVGIFKDDGVNGSSTQWEWVPIQTDVSIVGNGESHPCHSG